MSRGAKGSGITCPFFCDAPSPRSKRRDRIAFVAPFGGPRARRSAVLPARRAGSPARGAYRLLCESALPTRAARTGPLAQRPLLHRFTAPQSQAASWARSIPLQAIPRRWAGGFHFPTAGTQRALPATGKPLARRPCRTWGPETHRPATGRRCENAIRRWIREGRAFARWMKPPWGLAGQVGSDSPATPGGNVEGPRLAGADPELGPGSFLYGSRAGGRRGCPLYPSPCGRDGARTALVAPADALRSASFLGGGR